MAEKYILKRSKLAAGAEPGTWVPLGENNAMVTCRDNREHVATLSGHEIDEDGVVTPSLVCPYDGCKFHEWVKLEGWR